MIYEVRPDYHYRHRPAVKSMPQVVIYGTSWCGMTQMVRRFFDRRGIPYRYVDLDMHPEAIGQLRWMTGGYANHPTVYIDGQVLIEPTTNELAWALRGIA